MAAKSKKSKVSAFTIPFTLTVKGKLYVEGTLQDAKQKAKELSDRGLNVDFDEDMYDSSEYTDVHFDQIKGLE